MTNRESPDYRNSIKESVSAVEAVCRLLTGNARTTLRQPLGVLQEKMQLHPTLRSAFEKMYGYTSSADGIRHALMEKTDLDLSDAKFMLVACSAFVNYLMSKSSKAGIQFN